ncbi:hypothetical protein MRB53_038845 [Persea americana]|nr:hypothetical protein MRB53_038845 [Persea americana]
MDSSILAQHILNGNSAQSWLTNDNLAYLVDKLQSSSTVRPVLLHRLLSSDSSIIFIHQLHPSSRVAISAGKQIDLAHLVLRKSYKDAVAKLIIGLAVIGAWPI